VQRAVVVLLAVAMVLVVAGGTALAANGIKCPNRGVDRCVGTAQPDVMVGSRGDDTIRGRAGADTIRGRGGSDALHGEVGGDTIVAARCALGGGADVFGGRGGDDITITSDCGDLAVVPPPDRVDCGPGYDVVRGAVPEDRIADDCERVVPQRSF
jgi:Ca2+-binding RTX toxin-like protein